jgi:hypothetical protein
MVLKNINGMVANGCQCGSWLEHWKNFSRRALPAYCPEVYCTQRPELGALVQKDDPADTNWYVVPLCRKHFAATGKELVIDAGIKLVPTNCRQTGGQ